jgi:hypothetical protein
MIRYAYADPIHDRQDCALSLGQHDRGECAGRVDRATGEPLDRAETPPFTPYGFTFLWDADRRVWTAGPYAYTEDQRITLPTVSANRWVVL